MKPTRLPWILVALIGMAMAQVCTANEPGCVGNVQPQCHVNYPCVWAQGQYVVPYPVLEAQWVARQQAQTPVPVCPACPGCQGCYAKGEEPMKGPRQDLRAESRPEPRTQPRPEPKKEAAPARTDRSRPVEIWHHIMMQTPMRAYDPEVLLAAKEPLELTDPQIQALMAISQVARYRASCVLTEAQREKLAPFEHANLPRTMNQMQRQIEQRQSDRQVAPAPHRQRVPADRPGRGPRGEPKTDQEAPHPR